MMRMKEHVSCCQRSLRRMAVVTDRWDAQTFEHEHAREPSAWSSRGLWSVGQHPSAPGRLEEALLDTNFVIRRMNRLLDLL